MPLRLRAATVRATAATIAGQPGPRVPHYEIALDTGLLYKWVPDDTTAADAFSILTHSGGFPGRWHMVPGDRKGTDLADGNATITVAGKLERTLPASTLSGNSVLTLSVTGAVAGTPITITRLDAEAFTYAIANGGPLADTLITFPTSTRYFADLRFNGDDWRLLRAGDMA